MGHRALIAYERDDGTYNLHYSHWGATDLHLVTGITEATPLGGENTEPAFVSGFVDALDGGLGDDYTVGGEVTKPQEPTEVEPEPFETGVGFEEILSDHLDYLHHEAFYVVDRDFRVRGYRTLWFDLEPDIDRTGERHRHRRGRDTVTVGFGAVARPRWYPDPDEHPEDAEPVGDGMLQGRFKGAKEMLGRLVTRGVIGETEAYGELRAFCRAKIARPDSSWDYDLRFGFGKPPVDPVPADD